MNSRITLVKGDITEQQVDAIVNAANPTLLGGGGVDGAIHRRGGPAILEACTRIRAEKFPEGMPVAEAVITTAGALPARFVVHTVGPIWSGGGNHERALLADAYRKCLSMVAEEGLHSVAFPSISTGAYGYPKREAATVAVTAVSDFLQEKSSVREVRFVVFSEEDLRVYEAALAQCAHFPRGNT
jgi:O-acetyl-ADP-ribose deacetylase